MRYYYFRLVHLLLAYYFPHVMRQIQEVLVTGDVTDVYSTLNSVRIALFQDETLSAV